MIIDAFPFFNELDLLEIRLNELDSAVDKFILVEAELTQSLKSKPLYFDVNKKRFSKFLDKIVHVKVKAEECPSNEKNLWEMENFQRNKIQDGISSIQANDDDIVLISDLDEIPSSEIISLAPEILSKKQNPIFSIEMDFYAYFLNLKATDRKWIGTVCCANKVLKNYSPQILRNNKDFLDKATNCGWHFSWLGGYQKIYEKSLSCIEPFDKSTLPTIEEFKTHFDNFISSDKKFFIHLENLSKKQTEFSKAQIDESFPKFLIDNKELFSSYIL
jgi:beta-1,4-mannosyl-glycoprotein beta-1,4-N-acetylglucosaminyltransferase